MKKNRRPPFFAAVLPVNITIGVTFLLSLLVFLNSVWQVEASPLSHPDNTVAIVLGQR
jgi:hypothetical protein